ncbi:MAG: universal stress protein [Anaerolineales bacterium]|jgi:nucleotide-binding universal stress UspA family protein
MRWLISTDGTPRSQQAAKFAASLIQPEHDEVVLLGVINRTSKNELMMALDDLEAGLGGTVKKRVLEEGSMLKVMEKVAETEAYDTAVYASRGRRGLTKILLGSVAARLAQELPCSVLIIRKVPLALKKVLVATTLSPDHSAPIFEGTRMAALTGADVTLLHVMSQIPLADEEHADQLRLTAQQARDEGTREGRGFDHMLAIAEAEGVKVNPKIRYGLVEDEIIAEVIEGDYDLLVMGAHRATSQGPGLAELLIEDVTNVVLMSTRCPVLIVRK